MKFNIEARNNKRIKKIPNHCHVLLLIFLNSSDESMLSMYRMLMQSVLTEMNIQTTKKYEANNIHDKFIYKMMTDCEEVFSFFSF